MLSTPPISPRNGQDNSPNTPETDQLREIKEKVRSTDKSIQATGISELKTLVSQDNQSIENEIDENFILHIISLLNGETDLELQIECSSILSELCSKNNNLCSIINKGEALEKLINVLELDDQMLLNNVLSTMNSLLVECPKTRKTYFKQNCMNKVAFLVKKYPILPIKKNIVLFLFNMIHPKPNPSWKEIKSGVFILQEVIQGMQSGETLSKALWCVAAITDTNIEEIINLGLVPFLVQHTYNQSAEVFVPALRALGNIVTGSEEQTEKVLAHPNFLVRLFELILHPDRSVQKEVCWILSNIAAGSEAQKKQIISCPNYMNVLKNVLIQGDKKLSLEVSWVFSNLVSGYEKAFKDALVNKYEYCECLSIMFSKKNPKIDLLALEAIQNLLELENAKVSHFIQNNLADRVSQIPFTPQAQEAIDRIQAIMENMGLKSIQLKLAPEESQSTEKTSQDRTSDKDESEEGNEQSDDENED